jgi:hypothetical protein
MSDLFIRHTLRKRVLFDAPNVAFAAAAAESTNEEDDNEDEEEEDDDATAVVYLDEEEMRFEFSVCKETRDITKKFTVRLCAFELRQPPEHVPYVLHALQFDGQVFDFPQFTFQCAHHSDEGEDEVYFKNECLQHLADFVDDIQNVDYRGYVIDQTDVFVFYDIMGKKLLASTLTPRVWVTMDELVNQKFVLGHPVRGESSQFFLKHSHLIFVKQKGLHVYVPEIMYLCDVDAGGNIVNLDSVVDGDTAEPSVPFLINRVPHSTLGNFYIFSKFPIRADRFTWRRFVGFCEDGIYLTKPLPQQITTSWGNNLFNYFTSKENGPTGMMMGGGLLDDFFKGSTGQSQGLFGPTAGQGITGQGPLEKGITGQGPTGQGFGQGFFDLFNGPTADQGFTDQGITGQGPTGQGFGQGFFDLFNGPTAGQGITEKGPPEKGITEKGPPEKGFTDQGPTGQGFGQGFFDLFNGPSAGQGMTDQGLTEKGPPEEGLTEKGLTGEAPGLLDFFKGPGPTGPTGEEEESTKDPEDDATSLGIFLSNQSASCIYFQEMTTNERVPLWCIKSDDDYIEI